MLSCINKQSVEYQSLKDRAGIPDYMLEAYCREYSDKYGRFPYLDELPGSNSAPALKEALHVKDNNSANISDILEYTGSETIEEANIKINNIHRDLETEITPIVNEAIVEIVNRPTTSNWDITPITQDTKVNSYVLFNLALIRLGLLYGINFHTINQDELSSEEWENIIEDSAFIKGFVYNGEVYLNLDNLSVDTPLHEMMHLFIGSMRFSDPNLYSLLVTSITSIPNYTELAEKYPNRTQNDINEEIFVTEVAKHLTGLDSALSNLNEIVYHEVMYNVNRVLDSMLMGLDSVKTLSDVMNMTLKEIATKVNSDKLVNKFKGTFNAENSSLHRLLNNTKHDLLRNGTLTEECV